jgi:hypothetical protein
MAGVGETTGTETPEASGNVCAVVGAGRPDGDPCGALKQAVTRTVKATMAAAIAGRRSAVRWGTQTVSVRLAAGRKRGCRTRYGAITGWPSSVVPLTSMPNQREAPAPAPPSS